MEQEPLSGDGYEPGAVDRAGRGSGAGDGAGEGRENSHGALRAGKTRDHHVRGRAGWYPLRIRGAALGALEEIVLLSFWKKG